jgi:UDP-sulfoquinovose synthase
MVQAVAGFPLTIYGKGGQTRGYLDIKDTMQCVRLSVENPPQKGELRILNQFVELFSVNKLAKMVQRVGNQLGLGVQIGAVENPRKEAEEHYYNPVHKGLFELGLEPHHLTDNVLAEMLETVARFKENIQRHKVVRRVKWD